MGSIAFQITSLTIVYSIVYSDANQRKYQSSASLAFVRGIHRGPVNSPHKWPVTLKMFPFDDVIILFSHAMKVNLDETSIVEWSFRFYLGNNIAPNQRASMRATKMDFWNWQVLSTMYNLNNLFFERQVPK